MKTKTLMAALLASSLLTTPAVMAQADDEQLVVGALQFLTNFHPLIQVNNTKRNLITLSLRPITAFDSSGEVVCVLCEEVPTIENGLAEIVDNGDGTEGMRVSLTIMEGASWGDGTPVTSDDIVFTHQVATDENIGFSNYNPWTRASEIEVVDDRTVIIHLPEVLQNFNAWDQILPAHLERPIYEANGDLESYVRQTLYNREPTNPGLWNGSYILTDYQIGTRITFEPNPYWPGMVPDIERIIMSYRDNNSALMQNVLSGEIQLVPVSPGGISFSQMLDLRNQAPDRYNYVVEDGNNLERIALNLDNPILADLNVRKALLHGIDRQAITGALFGGLQPVANGLHSQASPFYTTGIATYAYDPEAAKTLLAEAGWTPGPDGICVNDNGDRLSFEFVTTAGNATREQIALVIQSQLREICVETNNVFAGLQEYNGDYARRRQFTGMIMSSIEFSLGSSPNIALGTSAIPSEENSWVGNNFSGYSSEAMDAAINTLEGSLERADRIAGWAEVQRIFAEDLPMLPLYFYTSAWVAPVNLQLEASSFDPEMTWAEEWVLN
ncbi:peptide ABC transporter substrate-binding protein [Devosia sp. Root635]|uniref:peptide ABC transporter substrate-binding protein n=1 Tax=Devosia sp. Root635 TaxID=1736575 RepID=UPI001FCD0B02|nr:peptide ABC transporter substrate-binding protein [Devosia sp. Root635]